LGVSAVDDEPIPDLKVALLQTSFNHGTYETCTNSRVKTILCAYPPEKDLNLARGIRASQIGQKETCIPELLP
jgi:hypothetical protein